MTLQNGDSANWLYSGLLEFFPTDRPSHPTLGFVMFCKVLAKMNEAVSDQVVDIADNTYVVQCNYVKPTHDYKIVRVEIDSCDVVVKWVNPENRHGLMRLARELKTMRHLRNFAGLNIMDFSKSVYNALVLAPVGKSLSFFTKRVDETNRQIITTTIRHVINQLRVLHMNGWVHGDIRPQNIIIDGDGKVFLIDWLTASPIGQPEFVANGMNLYAATQRLQDSASLSPEIGAVHQYRYDIESFAYTIASLFWDLPYKIPTENFKYPQKVLSFRNVEMQLALTSGGNSLMQGAAKVWQYALSMADQVNNDTYDALLAFFPDS